MAKRREIRNSTAEFLIFQAEKKEQGVEVYYKDENIWATQKAMATLFDVNVPAISKHLKNIFESGELKDDSVVSKMEITASDGKNYLTQFYSLDAIIAVICNRIGTNCVRGMRELVVRSPCSVGIKLPFYIIMVSSVKVASPSPSYYVLFRRKNYVWGLKPLPRRRVTETFSL